jgi:hypothetical protein
MLSTNPKTDITIIIEAAKVCAAEHAAQYEAISDGPETWTGDMFDADLDYAGQMIGRPMDEAESNTFDKEFRAHYYRLMNPRPW